MHKKKTLVRFAEIETFANVLQYPKDMKGNWKVFQKTQPNYSWSLPVAKANMLWAWAECTR